MSSSSTVPVHPWWRLPERWGRRSTRSPASTRSTCLREQQAEVLVELTRSLARLAALRADVLAVADDLAGRTANRSSGTWLALETRTSRREAIHDERLGHALRDLWPDVAATVAAGGVTWEQAGVLVRALEALPDSVDPEL